MKRLLILLFFLPFIVSSQDFNINAYKYLIIKETTYPKTKKQVIKWLSKKGYSVYYSDFITNNKNLPEDLRENPNLAIYLTITEMCKIGCASKAFIHRYDEVLLWKSETEENDALLIAIRASINPLLTANYKFDEKLAFNPEIKLSKRVIWDSESPPFSFDTSSEVDIKNYLDKNKIDPIEGIWIWTNAETGQNYSKTAIVKKGDKYAEIHIESINYSRESSMWSNVIREKGVSYGYFENMATQGLYVTKEEGMSSNAILEGNSLEVYYNTKEGNQFHALAMRQYPLVNSNGGGISIESGEWAGNGSGIIISKSGYIVTNYHVIADDTDGDELPDKNVDEIEVEFILNDEVQKFNAEIVQVDKINDLAIIKIVDVNFDGVDDLPYNFKTRSSDVGTKVYAYGYPMALTIMGKEIKITDGIISSKSGFDGDITTYQITAPIQGGNSGGPLFDDKGNFIGINSSGLNKEIADNVGYTIKSNYVVNLFDFLPKSFELPSSSELESLSLPEQIKKIEKYVVLVKIK